MNFVRFEFKGTETPVQRVHRKIIFFQCYKLVNISELVQLKLNIKRFYEVKYALDFGGGLYPHRSKNEGAYQRSVPTGTLPYGG